MSFLTDPDRAFHPDTAAARLTYWTGLQSAWWASETLRHVAGNEKRTDRELAIANAMHGLLAAQVRLAKAQIADAEATP